MTETGIQVDVLWGGIDDVSAGLKRMGLGATKALYPDIRRALKPYRTEIRKSAPLGLTGNLLKDNAKWSITRKGIVVSNKATHAHFVTQGVAGRRGKKGVKALPTSKGPNPFLHRAIGRRRNEIEEGILKALYHYYEKAAAANKADL